jgi:PAS domain S-box-containing protein
MRGIFSTHYRRAFRPDAKSLRLLDLLARQAADAIDRAQADADRHRSESRLRGLLVQSLAGIAETDAEGRFVEVNDRFCAITGRTRTELLRGVRMQDITVQQDLPGNLSLWRALLADGTPFEVEKRYRLPDGTTRWVHNSVSRVDVLPGDTGRFVAICVDIGDRKRAEAQRGRSDMLFRGLFETVDTGIVITDEAGRFERCNRAYQDIVGYDEAELRRMDPATLIHPDDRDHNLAEVRRLLDGTLQSFEVENRYVRKDGGIVWVSKRVSRIVDHSGQSSLLVLLVIDITARRRAAETRARTQRMEALGQLAGGMAHDFNNLMTIVSLSLDQILSRPVGAAGRRAASRARHAIDAGASLNRRLLAFARQRSLTTEVVSLDERVGAMVPILRRTLGDACQVVFAAAPGLWSTGADPGEIDTAILNIAINARDAMPGGGTITISTANQDVDPQLAGRLDIAPGPYVRLDMSDHGTGMAEHVVRRAVEPFFTTKPAGQGTGLGLSTVYGFARQSGGTLQIASEAGRGTTLRIYLPRAIAMPATVATTEPQEPRGAGETILVVEDNDPLREVTCALLTDLGYVPVPVREAADAVSALGGDTAIRLVFSDVAMPGGMDGFELLGWMRAHAPSVPMLLTSGQYELRDVAGRAAGATLLAKPYSRTVLAGAIRAAIESAPAR